MLLFLSVNQVPLREGLWGNPLWLHLKQLCLGKSLEDSATVALKRKGILGKSAPNHPISYR